MSKIRVLIAKVGIDSHDRGIKVVSMLLREEGMEVIFLGIYQSPESVIKAAIQEDVDVIGLSFHCEGHLIYTPRIVELMRENKMDDVLFLVGGIFPKEDIPLLKEMGVDGVFMGSTIKPIAEYIRQNVKSVNPNPA